MTKEERDELIELCAKTAKDTINYARDEGETDLRSVRGWVVSAILELKSPETA